MTTPSPRRRGCTIAAAVLFVMTSAAACLLCAIPYGAARIENAGPIALSEVGPDWQVRGQPEHSAQGLADGAMLDCRPMGNGLNVLFQHIWYNTITTGYDDRYWLEGPEGSYDSFGLYRWSNKIFVRDETTANGYNNQVLVCDTLQWAL
jgi:hypothetical protein